MLTDKQLEQIQKIIGYSFNNIELLKKACTHVRKGTLEAIVDGVLDVVCGSKGLNPQDYVSNGNLRNTSLVLRQISFSE